MTKEQKNILFIVVDCLRADFVYGEDKTFIPTIKKLEKNGYSFLNTISSTSTTTPSFASLLTGLYPFQNRVRSFSGCKLKKEIKTFPEILKENGYNTYAEVTGPLLEIIGLSKGFDEYNYRSGKKRINTEFGNDLLKKFDGDYKSPWFVLLHIWALHKPRSILKECNSRKFGKTIYGRAVSSIDKYLEKLVEKIDDDTIIILTGDHGEQISCSIFDGFWRKTILMIFKTMKKYRITKVPYSKMMRKIFTGHGYSIYDELIKVPLIFFNKDVVPKGKSIKQVRQIDIFPTILDLINIKYKNKVEGVSVLPLIKGQNTPSKEAYLEAVGIVTPNKEEWLAGLRIDNKYKYIYYPFRQDVKEELYDLQNDPFEIQNIAANNKDMIEKFRKNIEDMKTKEIIEEKLTEEDENIIRERLKSLGYID